MKKIDDDGPTIVAAISAALQKGDEVVLGGGELGRIVKIGDNYLTVEIAEGVQILLQKPAIQAVLPKGTIKAALD